MRAVLLRVVEDWFTEADEYANDNEPSMMYYFWLGKDAEDLY